jgi:hypothetical protein
MRHGLEKRTVIAAALCAAALGAGTGCVRVKQYERGRLASPAMARGHGDPGLGGEYASKLWESRTGGGIPGEAPGGGCGCTQ